MNKILGKTLISIRCLILVVLVFQFPAAHSQGSGLAYPKKDTAVMAKLIALRDDFVSRIKAQGFAISLKPPEIVMDNPRSFGNYEDSANVLHTGDWKTLPSELQEVFRKGAEAIGNGATGESYFEMGVHQWIFIHELGHWWRTCRHQTALPYDDEMAANRIATAYWRTRDPAVMDVMQQRFQRYLEIIPSPVPAGVEKKEYLNENYDRLPGASSYTWYQSGMIIDAVHETPAPTFRQAIERAGNAVSQ